MLPIFGLDGVLGKGLWMCVCGGGGGCRSPMSRVDFRGLDSLVRALRSYLLMLQGVKESSL